MKELSIEEKAKAYDEAIKYAHYLINERCKEGTDGSFHCSDLQKMFPELRESDNEKVKNILYCIIRDNEGVRNMLEANSLTVDKVLNWLEKQGEQKEYPQSVIDNAISFLSLRNDGMPIEEAEDIVNAIITVLNPSYWPKQGEQKPTEWTMDNIEELTEFENAMMHIGGSFFGEHQGLDPNDTDTIKEQANALLEFVPSKEWNYNDEIIIGTIIQEIEKIPSEKFIDNAKYRCLDWLRYRTKSLRSQNNITDEELAQAKKDAYNDALDKIEYHSGEPTFDDGWSAAIDYIRKKSIKSQNWTKEDKERYISCLQRLSTGNPEQPETINSKWFKEHVYPQST